MTPEKELAKQSDRELLIRMNVRQDVMSERVDDIAKKVERNTTMIAIGKGILLVLAAIVGCGWLWDR